MKIKKITLFNCYQETVAMVTSSHAFILIRIVFYINISRNLINAGKHRKTTLNAKMSSLAKPGAPLVFDKQKFVMCPS